MHNPYSPPKSDIVRKQQTRNPSRYYRIANWLYALIMGLGFVALLSGREIQLGLADLVVWFMMFSPVLGYLLATTIRDQGYILWIIVHWGVVIVLLLFSLYAMSKEADALEYGLFFFVVNLLSVTSNQYYRRKRLEASSGTDC